MQQLFEKARQNMINGQLIPQGVRDAALLEAFGRLPREKFLPPRLWELSYADKDIALGNGRYMPEPVVLARLVQAAAVRKGDLILDVGCGAGYSTAVLASLGRSVFGIEQDKDMVVEGVRLLDQMGIGNAVLAHQADVHQGYAKKAPYDVILINGAVAGVPEKIQRQLADGGRLATVLSHGDRAGTAVLVTRHGDRFSTRALFNAATPGLPGFDKKKGFVFQ